MDTANVIALVALGLSALTFVATQLTSKRSARQDYVEELEQRIEVLEERLEIVTRERDSLRDENLFLLRKLAGNAG